MQSSMEAVPTTKSRLWAGRVLSALPVLLLVFSALTKLMRVPAVVQGFAQYGYPENRIFILGILELLSSVVYVIPRTSVLGAILLTGYLGGATATNVRVGDPSFILPVVLGVLVWGGLFLRDDRVRRLLPFVRPRAR